MSAVPLFEPAEPAAYWEARAVRFGHVDDGLPAVCSYGMPHLYNQAIDICQRRALAPYLERCRDLDVLEVGCGVGRWSLPLARANRVLGTDLSRTMIEHARRRAVAAGVAARFEVADVRSVALPESFDLVLAVTVLQHLMADSDLDAAVANLAAHLRPGGRLLLLEVAPSRGAGRCSSAIFRSRPVGGYVDALERAGLAVDEIVGVDIAPLRPLLLPAVPLLPRRLARAVLTAGLWLSLPVDLTLSRRLPELCWHKILVATRRERR